MENAALSIFCVQCDSLDHSESDKILLVSVDKVMDEDTNFKLGKVHSRTHTWSTTKSKKTERPQGFLKFIENIKFGVLRRTKYQQCLISGRKLHRILRDQTFQDLGKLLGHGVWKQHLG